MNIVLSLIAFILGSIGLLKWLGFFKTGALGGNHAVNIGLLILPLSLMAGSFITLLQIWVVKAPMIETISYAALGYLFFPAGLAYVFLLGLISSKIGSWFFWFVHGLFIIGLSYKFNTLESGSSHFDFVLAMWAVGTALWLANWLKSKVVNTSLKTAKTLLLLLITALPGMFCFYWIKYSIFGLPNDEKSIFLHSLSTSATLIIVVACMFIFLSSKERMKS